VAGRIAARRVYDPPTPDEGIRVLIMRLWPRGIPKGRVDRWLRELGPVLPLLRAFRGGRISWPEYRRRYLAGLARPAARAQLQQVRALARAGQITLLCGCPDERRCHRTILREYLMKRRRPSAGLARAIRSGGGRGGGLGGPLRRSPLV
jgi:uncharacterized protein YeaO (DUF488 family)